MLLLLFLYNCRHNWGFCVVVEKHDGAKGASTWTRFVGDPHMLLDGHRAIKFGLVTRLQSILVFRVDHDRRANGGIWSQFGPCSLHTIMPYDQQRKFDIAWRITWDDFMVHCGSSKIVGLFQFKCMDVGWNNSCLWIWFPLYT